MIPRTPALLGLLLALAAAAPDDPKPDDNKAQPKDAPVGSSYKVPYRLTETNHFLVRVRVNGKGPFHFLVDTGAPALFVGTEAAKKVGIEPAKEGFWTPVERLDFEGGATLTGLRARVEDVFQLEGMNALGLAGTRIDGILGYTILAKFRIELDPTQDRMVWTRIDFNPKEPFVPSKAEDRQMPADVQIMQSTGKLAKFLGPLLKQPEEKLHPQGLLGVELKESDGAVLITAVLPGTPAARAGLKPGDRLVSLLGRKLKGLTSAHEAVARTKPGDDVAVGVRRGEETLDLTLTAAEGF